MLNKVMLIGNVGNDPEIKTFDNGGQVANLPLATSERYTNREGEKVEKTEWHNLKVSGKLADIFEKYVKKGDKLFVEGKLRYRKYKKDGETKYFTEILVFNFNFLSSKNDNNTAETPKEQPKEAVSVSDDEGDDTDDLPF